MNKWKNGKIENTKRDNAKNETNGKMERYRNVTNGKL